MLDAAIVFLAGLLVGLYLAMALWTVGKHKRSGRSRIFGRPIPDRWWAWALLVVWLWVAIPVGILHDTLRPGHPWLAWSGPDDEPTEPIGWVNMDGPDGELGQAVVWPPYRSRDERFEGALFCHVEYKDGGPFDGKQIEVPLPPAVAAFGMQEMEIAPGPPS